MTGVTRNRKSTHNRFCKKPRTGIPNYNCTWKLFPGGLTTVFEPHVCVSHTRKTGRSFKNAWHLDQCWMQKNGLSVIIIAVWYYIILCHTPYLRASTSPRDKMCLKKLQSEHGQAPREKYQNFLIYSFKAFRPKKNILFHRLFLPEIRHFIKTKQIER